MVEFILVMLYEVWRSMIFFHMNVWIPFTYKMANIRAKFENWSVRFVLAPEHLTLMWPPLEHAVIPYSHSIRFCFAPSGLRFSRGRQSAMTTLAMSKLASFITWVSTAGPQQPESSGQAAYSGRTMASVWSGTQHHMGPLHDCWLCSTTPAVTARLISSR